MMADSDAEIAKLREQLRQLEAELEARQRPLLETGGGAVITGDGCADRDFIGRDQILATLADCSVIIGGDADGLTVVTGDGNTIHLSPDQIPPDTLLEAYYRSLAKECCHLPLGVIDTQFLRTGHEQAIPLPEIYVDLDVTAPTPTEGEDARAWGLRMIRGEGSERTPLLEALSRPENTRAVLLGDPGSGKTTFVQYLSYCLTTGSGAIPETLRGRLPVRLVLRKVAARHIPADAPKGEARMLWAALEDDIAARLGTAAATQLCQYLLKRLCQEGGIILLDGLDEVPEAQRRRQVLLEAIQRWAAMLPAGRTRLLVTARPYAYADPQWRLSGFPVLVLAPFNELQVQHFIDCWYRVVRPALGWNEETAQAKASDLLAAVQDPNRSYLADLASRPLLLTLMTTIGSSGGQLPEDRGELYEEAVKLLLGRWQRAREVKGPGGELVVEPSISQILGVGEESIRSALESLALTVHEQQRTKPEHSQEPADITEGQVLVAFKSLLGRLHPDDLLGYLRDRAGLLIARREGVYAFPHRSFQEYLAACRLADQPNFAEELQKRVWADPNWWREVFLLGVGKAKQGGLGTAVGVVNTLLPENPEDVENIQEIHWRSAVFAGQALVELRLAEKATGQPHYQAILKRARRWLAALIEGGHLPPRERLGGGDALRRLGDPRPGVGVIAGPNGPLPDIAWVEIPAGPFTMGTPEDDERGYANERPAHSLNLPHFYISRYPITNAQYRSFVEAGGYDNPDYWTQEGWAWRNGAEADLSAIHDEAHKKQLAGWLAERPAERRDRPYWWNNPQWGTSNCPVIGVSWYEALAYTNWLNVQLQTMKKSHSLPVPAGYRVHLPTEAEWEKAARGTDARRWSWGNDWQEGLANTQEADLDQTSPVGLFPGGASPYGVLDMAGNVWEWTTSRWGKTSIYKPDYAYPYRIDDGRECLDGPDLRVVRGGSWIGDLRFARCAFRDGYLPGGFLIDLGFRVVVSLVDSEC